MKKSVKIVALVLVLCVCIAIFSACGFDLSPNYTASLKGKDGLNGIDGKDGKDAPAVTISEIYTEMVNNGYTGTFKDFIYEFLSSTQLDQTEAFISSAVLSCVSIRSTFTRNVRDGLFTTREESYYAAGSGVIYKLGKSNGDAYIITNYHVVYDSNCNTPNRIAKEISVMLYGKEISGMEIPATYVGGSMTYDIAVLRVSNSEILRNSDARAVDYFDSNDITVGETAIAIGNPEGSGLSVTSGIISVDSEQLTMTGADNVTNVTFRVMRIDTAVNGGNSGGGLFNAYGEWIGIVNAKSVKDNVDNIGYAIPSNIAKYVADNIIYYGQQESPSSVKKCMLGITISTIDSKAVYNNQTKRTSIIETIQVQDVTTTGIGNGILQKGDILKSITIGGNEYAITRSFIVVDIMLTARVGDEVSITFERNGQTMTKSLTLTTRSITNVV